jgi:hypothetical protein
MFSQCLNQVLICGVRNGNIFLRQKARTIIQFFWSPFPFQPLVWKFDRLFGRGSHGVLARDTLEFFGFFGDCGGATRPGGRQDVVG